MITVHHLNNSRSQRILWLLEELGLQYEIKRYQRDPKTQLAPKALREVHPLGKSPVITDGEVTVAESGAIVEYLVSTYGKGRLIPPATAAESRRRYTYWLHFAEGSAMTPLLLALIFSKMPAKSPWLLRPLVRLIAGGVLSSFVQPQIKAQMSYVEGELGKHTWFAGEDFTAADIQMSFPLEGMQVRAEVGAKYPKMAAFLDRIHARPAYKAALERGGEYNLGAL